MLDEGVSNRAIIHSSIIDTKKANSLVIDKGKVSDSHKRKIYKEFELMKLKKFANSVNLSYSNQNMMMWNDIKGKPFREKPILPNFPQNLTYCIGLQMAHRLSMLNPEEKIKRRKPKSKNKKHKKKKRCTSYSKSRKNSMQSQVQGVGRQDEVQSDGEHSCYLLTIGDVKPSTKNVNNQ